MKRISEELARVRAEQKLAGNDFFIDRKYKTDMEWWILGNAMECLHAGGFAEKWGAADEGDFRVYDDEDEPLSMVEVTEVLLPGRKRTDEYKNAERGSANDETAGHLVEPIPNPWAGLHEILQKKMAKNYPVGTWLIVYFNIPYGHISEFGQWDTTLFANTGSWDLSGSPLGAILVMDANAKAMVKLFPDKFTIFPER